MSDTIKREQYWFRS